MPQCPLHGKTDWGGLSYLKNAVSNKSTTAVRGRNVSDLTVLNPALGSRADYSGLVYFPPEPKLETSVNTILLNLQWAEENKVFFKSTRTRLKKNCLRVPVFFPLTHTVELKTVSVGFIECLNRQTTDSKCCGSLNFGWQLQFHCSIKSYQRHLLPSTA